MPYYQKLGHNPRKHHIWFHRNGAAPTYKNEGIAYEHVVTTQGFDRAYSIMYHLRPPTRVKKVESAGTVELNTADDRALRHHHLKSFELPRAGDSIRGRVPMMFNSDLAVWRCKPESQQTTLF